MIGFNEAWYLREYPEVRRELEVGLWASAETHYHQRGSREGRSPSAYFDEKWYRETYPDVAAQIAAGAYRSGLHHYLVQGNREQRSPNPVFDEQWYLRSNPDVADSVARGDLRCGFDHYLRNGEFEGRSPNAASPPHKKAIPSFMPTVVESLIPFSLHVWFDPEKRTSRRLNLVLPSLRMRDMSGGPNTALTLVAELSKLGVPIRLLSSNEGVDPDLGLLRAHIENLSVGSPIPDLEIADASNANEPAAIGSNDIFFATAWWTAQMIAEVLPRMRRGTFFYLIQDFEPGFHAWSTDYSLALETYEMDIVGVINSASLADYLVENRIGRFADPAFRSRTLIFEPAIDRRHFYPEAQTGSCHRRLLFYARPTIASRNLFEAGLSALAKVAARGLFPPDQWSLHFIGENLPETPIGNGVVIRPFPWLDFDAYARLLRTSDVLLSLMMSPHPSYAPLEMAACGGIVVTNSFACKTQERLWRYSPKILAPPPYTRTIADALERAVTMIADGPSPTGPLGFPSTWPEAFGQILPTLKAAWDELA